MEDFHPGNQNNKIAFFDPFNRFDIDGFVTGFGNPDWARTHEAATQTAPAVSAVVERGAACIGKTVIDEMAFRSALN